MEAAETRVPQDGNQQRKIVVLPLGRIDTKPLRTTVEALFCLRLNVNMASDDTMANWIFQEIGRDVVIRI